MRLQAVRTVKAEPFRHPPVPTAGGAWSLVLKVVEHRPACVSVSTSPLLTKTTVDAAVTWRPPFRRKRRTPTCFEAAMTALRLPTTIAALLLVASLSGCTNPDQEPAAPPGAERAPTTTRGATAPAPASPETPQSSPGAFAGRWTGPEGLFLEVTATADERRVRVRLKDTLDTEATYDGIVITDGIQFVRGGRTEVARRGSGGDTGFSALQSGTDCLIVRQGVEGYCRTGAPSVAPSISPVAAATVLPLTKGTYVSVSETCADPSFAGLKTFDGLGLAGAHTRECRARIVEKTGSAYTVDNSCIDAGAGPAPRSTERLIVAITAPNAFVIRSGSSSERYRLCPQDDLPMALRMSPDR